LRKRVGNAFAATVREASIRWLSCCRVVWPRGSWIGSVGRATVYSHHQARSISPAAARTGLICASTFRRFCTGSAPGLTRSLLFVLRGVDENELIASAGRDFPLSRATHGAAKVLNDTDVAALFGLEMANTAGSDDTSAPKPKRSKPAKRSKPPRNDKIGGAPASTQDSASRGSRSRPEPKSVSLVLARKRRANRRARRAA
jgi:hypothetical protein